MCGVHLERGHLKLRVVQYFNIRKSHCTDVKLVQVPPGPLLIGASEQVRLLCLADKRVRVPGRWGNLPLAICVMFDFKVLGAIDGEQVIVEQALLGVLASEEHDQALVRNGAHGVARGQPLPFLDVNLPRLLDLARGSLDVHQPEVVQLLVSARPEDKQQRVCLLGRGEVHQRGPASPRDLRGLFAIELSS